MRFYKLLTILVSIMVISFAIFLMGILPSYIQDYKQTGKLNISWLIPLIIEFIGGILLLIGGILTIFNKNLGRKLIIISSTILIFIDLPILTYVAYILFGPNSLLGLISTFLKCIFYIIFIIYFSLPKIKNLFKPTNT